MRLNAPPETALTPDELAEFAQAGRLYAVLDACDAPGVLDKIRDLPDHQSACLYINQAEEDFSAFAPYLLTVDAGLLEWTFGALSEEGGGIFVVSDAGRESLHKHFRRFLLALAPDGEEMYFRFYDPRVLPKFLAACTEAERRDLFGPVLAFGIVKEGAVTLLPEKPGPLPTSAAPRPARPGLFQVRLGHMQAFQEEGERAFEFSLIEHLREYHTDLVEVFPDDILVELVRRGIRRAEGYGLYSEADLTAFVAIMFEIAPDFDRHPYIQDVLTDRRRLPSEKIDALVNRVPSFVWEEAVGRNAPKA